jgi:hypothetical protein
MKNEFMPTLAEYVIKEQDADTYSFEGSFDRIVQHTKLITSKVNISLFVPAKLVDDEWVVLSEPYGVDFHIPETVEDYYTALGKVMFEDMKAIEMTTYVIVKNKENELIWISLADKTIQDLIKLKLPLTEYGKSLIQ